MALGDTDKALEAFNTARSLKPTLNTTFQIGRCLDRKNDAEGAIRQYQLAAKGGWPDAWIQWSELVARKGDPKNSLKILKQALARSNHPKLQIAFIERILSESNPSLDDLQMARRQLLDLNARTQGRSPAIIHLEEKLRNMRAKTF